MKHSISSLALLLLLLCIHESSAKRNLRGQKTKVFIPISQPEEVQEIVQVKEEQKQEAEEENDAWAKEEAYLESLGVGAEDKAEAKSAWEKEEAYIASLQKENAKESAVEVEEVVEVEVQSANEKASAEDEAEQESVPQEEEMEEVAP